MIKTINKSFLILAGFSMLHFTANAQMTVKDELPRGWHLKDSKKDGFHGISIEQAYEFVKSKNTRGKTIIVAVIDSGIDTTHEDLKPVLWRNPGEIPGNGIDDDKNGYVDDVYGWNFIGGKDGTNVKVDSYEMARVYHKFKNKFIQVEDPSILSAEDKKLYKMWLRAAEQVSGDPKEQLNFMLIKNAYKEALNGDSVMQKLLGKATYLGSDVEAFSPVNEEGTKAKRKVLTLYHGLGIDLDRKNAEILSEIDEYVSGQERKLEAAEKAPRDYRGEIVKDNYSDFNDRFYGNNDVMANTPFHGTHVSGIIGAVRNNKKGMNGVADNVKIMTIRAVPDGDEHDKDIALGIRYAVDNGAQIINMSFGKGFSPEKKWVDEAVKYAEEHDVLLVHAAGNDASNIDEVQNYPQPAFESDGYRAPNWITVGASSDAAEGSFTASFSNYGKTEVDVFAPGVKIYSTIPGGNTYGNAQGTSMASPVVAGVAAFILSYYPELSAKQVKYVIEKTAGNPGEKINKPGTEDLVDFSEISKNGGIVNAYEAIKLASTLKGERKTTTVKTKSTVSPQKKN
ncbi:MAG: S8 family serine peptidase [Chitinophagaceae bacterium]|jgi:subtilisin family serine protease|nr:S8 family serine peptidase [Chitinophagaceae bacterium]